MRKSASNADAEIAVLKQQLRLMEQKLDAIQKQTAANTTAAAKANAKADAKVTVANANAAIPVKGPGHCAVRRRGENAEQPADHLHRG